MMNSRSPYAMMVQQQRGGGLGAGQGIRPAARPQPAAPRKQDGGMGALGGVLGGVAGSMMSDERSKKEIERLEGANEALSAALASAPKASYPNPGAPSSGLQALGQQQALPSHANFADTPAANKVAAQNVGLQQANPGAAQAGAMAGAAMPRPGFDVNTAPPNLAALDEAYRRMGQGG